MANIKSQKKRIITNEKARLRNRAVKSELKTATRRVKDAVEAGNGAEAYSPTPSSPMPIALLTRSLRLRSKQRPATRRPSARQSV